MTARTTTEIVRQNVREFRRARGWSGRELADRLAALGIPWTREIVANLENGRRHEVYIDEVMALAIVFEIPPIDLMLPADDQPVRLTDDVDVPARTARAWVLGHAPLPGQSPRQYFSEVPEREWLGAVLRWAGDRAEPE